MDSSKASKVLKEAVKGQDGAGLSTEEDIDALFEQVLDDDQNNGEQLLEERVGESKERSWSGLGALEQEDFMRWLTDEVDSLDLVEVSAPLSMNDREADSIEHSEDLVIECSSENKKEEKQEQLLTLLSAELHENGDRVRDLIIIET